MTKPWRYHFPKSLRLIRPTEFTWTLRSGGVVASDTLVVFVSKRGKSKHHDPKLGITIPRKTGNAVVRNRWKRHIREAFRIQQHDLPKGIDIVVRPRKGARFDGAVIRSDLAELIRRAQRRAG